MQVGRPSVLIPEGTVIGRLTVIGPGTNRGKNRTSLCRCSCGVEKEILNLCLRAKKPTQSCGCWSKEKASLRVRQNPPRLKHGWSGTPTYSSWLAMIARCYQENNISYPNYGAKGVRVCKRWLDNETGFQNFLEDVGERPSMAYSLDRIKERDYKPGNCRWATRSQQNQNVGLKKSNTTGYKGVHKHWFRWTAEIRNNGTKHYIGLYETIEEAALAYNIASEKLQGSYGVRNVLPSMNQETKDRVFQQVTKFLEPESIPLNSVRKRRI